ncbi:4'-phosphopantetheinyl transferase family protein [Vibrio vulnificus]|uniref:4'-phosphopantetheinyl transferase family protein n=1 Tax=Vibrio vulnificus TaxID=672 RepID=UPI00165DC1A8|nr:4'-phosphopantetheinyl transferase superfamily protein [Vibrio vulnificus]
MLDIEKVKPHDLKSILTQLNVCVLWRRVSYLSHNTRAYWLSMLDKNEREKASRFRFAEDRDSFIAGHALLRQSLSLINEASPCSWKFSKGSNGKPEIIGNDDLPHLRINLSHTRGMVAVALGLNYNVGVDVEPLSRPIEREVWEHALAPIEASQLRLMPAHCQSRAFMALWTLKEALVKASGQGLSVPLNSLVCRLSPPQLLESGSLLGRANDWKVWQHYQDNSYAITVAAHTLGASGVNCIFLEASPSLEK